jgi:ATPase subunit of ABC transporter with duplicated ATPase domains
MKKIRFVLIGLLLVSLSALNQSLSAQEQSNDEKEKELKIMQEIEQQKKAIAEQKKAQEEAFINQQEDVEKAMQEAQKQIEAASKYNNMVRSFRSNGDLRRFEFNGEPIVVTPDINMWRPFGDNEEMTSWNFTKSIKDKSFTNDYTFDVDASAKNVVMSVNGDCKDGEIRIKIIMPNGKTYSDIVIDEFGNLNWRKSFNITEGENKDKVGTWKFKVDANKASGFFRISLQSN